MSPKKQGKGWEMPSLKIQRENVTTSQMSQREQGTSEIGHKAIDKVRASRVPPGVMDMTISIHARPFLNQGTRMRLALFVHLTLSFPNELEAFTISSHNKPSLASFSRRHFQGPTFTAPTPPGSDLTSFIHLSLGIFTASFLWAKSRGHGSWWCWRN